MNQWLRVGLAVLAIIGIFGLGVHYDSTVGSKFPYPTTEELATDYDEYVGEQAFVFGTVESVTGDSATIRVDTPQGPMSLTVDGFDVTVQHGGTVQVYGTLEPDQRITATNVEVVNSAGSSKLFKYGISAVGAVVILVQFFRHWRVDTATFAFEVRDDG